MTCSPIHTAFPDAQQLLALEPEELGGVVLELLKAQVGSQVTPSNNTFQRGAFIHLDRIQGYPREYQQAILAALRGKEN